MSESPDIPALIESLQMMEDLNDLPLKPRHRRTLRGAIDALAALSVSQPSGTSVAAMIEERYPLNGSDPDTAIALRNAARVGAALAAARSSVQPTTASSEELAEAFKEAHYDSALDAYGDEGAGYDWDAAVSAFLTSPAHRAAFPSVPTVTAEQIAEAARIIFGEYTGNAALGFDKPAYSHDRQKAERVAAAVLARSGGAPNFNSQPDLKETGTSGGAPTAQPTRDEIARVLSKAWSERIGEADDKGADGYHFTQADTVLALLSAQPAETEWEYAVREDGATEPYSVVSVDLDWLLDDGIASGVLEGCHVVRRRACGQWEPVPADAESEELNYESCKLLPLGTVVADAEGYWADSKRHYIKTGEATWAVGFGQLPTQAMIDQAVAKRQNNLSPCPCGKYFVHLPADEGAEKA